MQLTKNGVRHAMKWSAGVVLGLGSLGFGAVNKPANPHWNIFAGHERFPLEPSSLPAVGKLRFQIGQHGTASCTGTLIGKKLVLTAAHCFSPVVEYNREIEVRHLEDEVDARHLFFLPGFTHGVLPSGANPVPSIIGEGWMGDWAEDSANNRNDWAIVKLEHSPTSDDTADFGTLEVSEEPLKAGTALIAVGYSGDFKEGNTAGVDNECHVRRVLQDGSFFHDCAIEHGASGGPLLAIYIDGERVTSENEARLKRDTKEKGKVEYKIVGVITAEIKRRRPQGFDGYLGENAPFSGNIFGADEGQAMEEYSDRTPNVGNAAKNFATAVKEALSSEKSGVKHSLFPAHPRDEDEPRGRFDDENSGPYFFHITAATK